MKPDLMEILCCPLDRAELKLTSRKTEGGEVLEGVLTCTKCGTEYPIEDGIPNLLPPDERS
ncbi:MAG: methytransferase partner Trm112 [Thermoplasmata archaeon]